MPISGARIPGRPFSRDECASSCASPSWRVRARDPWLRHVPVPLYCSQFVYFVYFVSFVVKPLSAFLSRPAKSRMLQNLGLTVGAARELDAWKQAGECCVLGTYQRK
jgi:hypothetical protein